MNPFDETYPRYLVWKNARQLVMCDSLTTAADAVTLMGAGRIYEPLAMSAAERVHAEPDSTPPDRPSPVSEEKIERWLNTARTARSGHVGSVEWLRANADDVVIVLAAALAAVRAENARLRALVRSYRDACTCDNCCSRCARAAALLPAP